MKKFNKLLTNCAYRGIMFKRRIRRTNARVVELVDSLDSGSSAHSGHAGSSPASRTKQKTRGLLPLVFVLHAGVAENLPRNGDPRQSPAKRVWWGKEPQQKGNCGGDSYLLRPPADTEADKYKKKDFLSEVLLFGARGGSRTPTPGMSTRT